LDIGHSVGKRVASHVSGASISYPVTRLKIRPVYVRTPERTRGHVLVMMLAHLIRREPSRAWAHLDGPTEVGLNSCVIQCSTLVKHVWKRRFLEPGVR
jgi:hypothetical protein